MVRLLKRKPVVAKAKAKKSAAPKAAAKASAAAKSAGKDRGNGLVAFSVHNETPKGKISLASAAKAFAGPAALAAAAPLGLKATDPETAARHHLEAALVSPAVKKFARPKTDRAESQFKTINVEAVPLAGTTVVKFRQAFHDIPVYGSLVTVELDENQQCLGINSSLGTPSGVAPVAKIAPAEAQAKAAAAAKIPLSKVKNTPRLYFYYDQQHAKWHLAWIIEDVPQGSRKVLKDGRADALRKDYVIDAHSGKLLAGLPRTPTAAAKSDTAVDGLKAKRTIAVEISGKQRRLRDKSLNVTTYNFDFGDPSAEEDRLPGKLVSLPPKPWAGEAISAHANAEEVSRFLRTVVQRSNIDGAGGEMISSVNCWDRSESTEPEKEWRNAFWNGKQMVYGQIQFPDGTFYSVANMLDIVGHEMFHGVTDHTSRLEYQTQSGALNESYSDIFGVIIANQGKPIGQWNWELGAGFDGPGTALRDFEDPTRHDQPKLMKNFRKSTPPYRFDTNDYGWVHDNSGIHNYAAFRIITAKDGGAYLFTSQEVASLFYIALTVQLSRTSQFTDSRRAVVQTARTLFRNDPPATRDAKVKAVEDGFTAAGIK